MWDTTGQMNMATKEFPGLEVVPYEAVEYPSSDDQTPNDLRVWLEEMEIIYSNCQQDDWELFLDFALDIINYYTYNFLLVFFMFESISNKKFINKKVEVPFAIPGTY